MTIILKLAAVGKYAFVKVSTYCEPSQLHEFVSSWPCVGE